MSDFRQRIANLSPEQLAHLQSRLSQKGIIAEEGAHPRSEVPDGPSSLTIVPAPEQRHLPFPLTDMQQAYWVGRTNSVELGGVSGHNYYEVDCVDLDLKRLELAWQRLVDRHDMLRAIISSDGEQQILETVPPYQIEVQDLSADQPQVIQSRLETVRERMSHQVLPSDQWPLFEIRASRFDDRRFRLHISIDFLILDAPSISLLFSEWERCYHHPEALLPPLELSFRDYVIAEAASRDTDSYRRAREYWWSRLSSLPAGPDLPIAKNPSSLVRPRFTRYEARLDPQIWLRLKERASQNGLSPSVVLLTAFAEILAAWSKTAHFSINLTSFKSFALDPRLKGVLGDFTSSTLLAVDNPAHADFVARASANQLQLQTDLEHSSISGVEVIRELIKRRGAGPKAVMPVVFTSLLPMEPRFKEAEPTAWLGDTVYRSSQTAQVSIDHVVREFAGALVFSWSVAEEIFPPGVVPTMFDAYCRLLRRLGLEEDAWHESRSETARKLLPARQLEGRAPVDTPATPVSSALLHTLFAEQVPRRPDQPAVVAANQTLTYQELHRRANQLGGRLRQMGARRNKLVAVVMEKGWEQVVAVLGILASGAAYLPLDAGLPKERLWHLLKSAEVEFALTQSWLNESLEWPEGVGRLCVDNQEEDSSVGVGDQPIEPLQEPDDLAYVIYTSGSTGLPKGVMIDHRGAVNTILDVNRRFDVGPQDRVLAISSLSFDLSVYDIFGTLAAGGTIVVPEASGTRDPAHWAELIAQQEVTVWDSVPTLMKLLVEYVTDRSELLPSSLRLVLMSGDWIPVSLPSQINALAEGAQVISLGGATEASIWSILYQIEAVDPAWTSIPYGRPMTNQSFHVLDEALEPCPVGLTGQLYIGGIGLAKGYWRDEDKTRASFIVHPRTGERLYRTGDLGRYLPDGNIEFLGREDSQVKIQGYRVEPGEVEASLDQHPGVRAAVVTAVGEPREEKRLVAYVVPNEDEAAPGTSELRSFLLQKLPEHMVPSAYVMLDELPLTPNGKVDRRALPDPPDTSFVPSDHPEVENTTLIARIAQIPAEVLGVGDIDPRTNLLEAGATSVDMVRIVNRLDNELGFRPKLEEFYQSPNAMWLATAYERHRQSLVPTDGLEWAAQASVPAPETVLTSFELLLDPEEREAFKNKQLGLRRGDDEKPQIQLFVAEADENSQDKYTLRRSYRRFAIEPIPFAQFSEFLGCLRQIRIDGKPKYLYASAGGLYPVQTYLYVKPGRVEALPAGIYYYHAVEHRLVLLSADVVLDRGLYDLLINAPVFDEAAFSIFLIAQLGAIAPLYGERSAHFATIEAGLMAQLLETSAPSYGIGLCQIGHLDFQRIRHLFALDESHAFVHSLLGGSTDTHQEKGWSPFQEAYRPAAPTVDEREEGEI